MDNGVAFVTGRLTRDPQFFGEGEKRRVVFSIAFNRGKEERRKTTFIDCIAWGRRADILESFKKGSGVSVSGDLETDSWEDKEGQKQSRLRLNINTITATTSNRREVDGAGDNVESEETPVAATPAKTARTPAASGKGTRSGSGETANIPF
jgi:single stranded DNA-binding protein (ssb)